MASSLTTQSVMFIFMVSTLFGLNYMWGLGSGESTDIQGLADSDGGMGVNLSNLLRTDSEIWGFILDLIVRVIDVLLEFVSWLSMFGLVKGILYALLPADLYVIFNLFLLRPIGWIAALITTEWVLNKIRGASEN